MKRLLVAIIGIPLLLGGVALILIGVLDNEDDKTPSSTSTPIALTTRTASPRPATSTPRASVCDDNPDPATAATNQVDTPTAAERVRSGFTVSGKIVAFEATFRIQIRGADGNVISGVQGRSAEGQTLASYSEDVPYLVVEETPACLWVYENSAANGNPKNVVQIAITLEPQQSVCLTNPDPTTSDVVQVDAPESAAIVSSPVTVSGKIVAFEATFQITILSATGEHIADHVGHSAQGQTLSPFSEKVAYSVNDVTPACIWVYEKSARDGKPVHVVQIPIVLQP